MTSLTKLSSDMASLINHETIRSLLLLDPSTCDHNTLQQHFNSLVISQQDNSQSSCITVVVGPVFLGHTLGRFQPNIKLRGKALPSTFQLHYLYFTHEQVVNDFEFGTYKIRKDLSSSDDDSQTFTRHTKGHDYPSKMNSSHRTMIIVLEMGNELGIVNKLFHYDSKVTKVKAKQSNTKKRKMQDRDVSKEKCDDNDEDHDVVVDTDVQEDVSSKKVKAEHSSELMHLQNSEPTPTFCEDDFSFLDSLESISASEQSFHEDQDQQNAEVDRDVVVENDEPNADLDCGSVVETSTNMNDEFDDWLFAEFA
ncbi:hypothetical protein C9374_010779 [Naegleria lovaniensis]|uniref:Uncharacterized protein n=1 Tax=Naegleria lovaniensis TaxID=51637 RepID=A0AA88KD81_NAELO|nr:uncharacterized protein C9374_010779 [Naegleria lovaniensis]KAG2374495.1 hypothetical protein C9374_010779 [Naegleria lovaniensis]